MSGSIVEVQIGKACGVIPGRNRENATDELGGPL